MSETKKRGFAAMSPERMRDVARMGGLAVQQKGPGNRFTAEDAREAGASGGEATFEKHGAEHMAKIGKAGGIARGEQQKQAAKARREAR